MAQMSSVLARLKRDPIADLPIAAHVNQVLQGQGVAWRDRLLPPLVMLRLFLLQILSGNVAIAALRQLSGLDFAPSSYCEARDRLPLQLFCHLALLNARGVFAAVRLHQRRKTSKSGVERWHKPDECPA